MTVSEVVNKLAMEQALALGDLDTLPTCRRYIQMALSIGIDHFTKEMDEVIMMTKQGEELKRFRGIKAASRETGISASYIASVTNGRRHSAGGFLFIKSKDKELILAREGA